MTMLPMSDVMLESIYDIVNKQDGEGDRQQVARAARLAAEYRAMQLKRQRMQRAIERRAAERRELTGASRIEPQCAGDDPFGRDGA